VALRAAAERAERLRNFVQAASFLERTLELDVDTAGRAAQQERIGDLLVRGGATRRAGSRFREALAALPGESGSDDVARVTAKVATEILSDLRVDDAIAYLEEAVARFGPALDGPGRVSLEGQLGRAYFLALRHDQAAVVLRRTIEAAERIGPQEALIEAMVSLGSSGMYGDHLSDLALLFGSAELAGQAGLWRAQMRALNNLASYYADRDLARSREISDRLIELGRRIGYDPLGWEIGNFVFHAWSDGVEAAVRMATELEARIEPGSRDEEELASELVFLDGYRGDWGAWQRHVDRLRTFSGRAPEGDDWADRAVAEGLLLQGRHDEAAVIVARAAGPRTAGLRPIVGLLTRDATLVRASMPDRAPSIVAGPLPLGLHAVATAGLDLLEDGDADLGPYLDGLPLLRRGEDMNMWTLAVVALIGIVGSQPAGVREAVATLRAELERIGAAGPLGALDLALAGAPTTSDDRTGAAADPAMPSPTSAGDQAAAPSPA